MAVLGFDPTTRIPSQEILDAGTASDRDVRESLADLRRANVWLGGRRVLRLLIQEQVRRARLDRFTLLDLGTGSGEMASFVAHRFGASVTGLDRYARHMQAGVRDGWTPVAGDVRAMPFGPRSFDLVAASLLLHHFPNDEAVEVLRAMARVARHAVLINDLERHALPWLFIRHSPFARSEVSRLDGAASFQQAYTAVELEVLARRAGFTRFRVRKHFPFRLSLVVEVS